MLLGARRAAAYLDLSSRSFYELSKSEGFPAPVAVPGMPALRWRREDLRAWVRALPQTSRRVA